MHRIFLKVGTLEEMLHYQTLVSISAAIKKMYFLQCDFHLKPHTVQGSEVPMQSLRNNLSSAMFVREIHLLHEMTAEITMFPYSQHAHFITSCQTIC